MQTINTSPPAVGGQSSGSDGGGEDNDEERKDKPGDIDEDVTVILVCGSYGAGHPTFGIGDPGPKCEDQMTAWDVDQYGNPFSAQQLNQYPGDKLQMAKDLLTLLASGDITGDVALVCYSAGADVCMILYALTQAKGYQGANVSHIALLGPTGTGTVSLQHLADPKAPLSTGLFTPLADNYPLWQKFVDVAHSNGVQILFSDSSNINFIGDNKLEENRVATIGGGSVNLYIGHVSHETERTDTEFRDGVYHWITTGIYNGP